MRITKLSLTRGGTAPDPEGCNTLSISFEVSVKADLAEIIRQCQVTFGQDIGSWSLADATVGQAEQDRAMLGEAVPHGAGAGAHSAVEAAEKAPPNPTEASQSQTGSTPSAQPASRRKANRLGEPEAGATPLANPPSGAEAAPTTERPSRRRSSSSETPASAEPVAATPTTPASDQTPAPSTSRRRAASSQAAEPTVTTATGPSTSATAKSPSDEPSDADLAKAASLGARTLTPRVVTEFLNKNFEVKSVGELKGKRRQEFIDFIKGKIEEEK